MIKNRKSRILVVDDNQDIHDDIKKILLPSDKTNELDGLMQDILGDSAPVVEQTDIRIDSALQGDIGVEMVRRAKLDGDPYALVYVDIRIPPGLDGVQTIKQLQQEDDRLQYVIITAYSDYSWQDISEATSPGDNLLILKKPFESIEIRQSASALIEKYHLARENEEAMAALADQNKFLNTVINSLPHPFYVVDIDTYKVVAANTAAGVVEDITGEAMTCYQLSHSQDTPCHENNIGCPMLDVRKTGKSFVVEHQHLDEEGIEHPVEVHGYPVVDKQGRVVQMIEYNIDITSKKKLEEELIHSKKMETVAVMAGGIAHDFNNLLMAITGNIELASMELSEEHNSFEFLAKAINVSMMAKELTNKFLLFSKFASLERQDASAADLVTVAGDLVLAKTNVDFEFHLADDLWLAYVDSGQISQVLCEVFKNAKESMPDGGHVTVTVENIRCVPRDHSDGKAGKFIRITIADQGCG